MHPLEYLLDRRYTLQTVNGLDLVRLSQEQTDRFNAAVKLLMDAVTKREILTTFRGDSYANMISRVEDEGVLEGVVYQKTFYFGSKSKHFLETQPVIDARQHLCSIEDVSDATFTFIFEKVARVCGLEEYRTRRFWRENPDIPAFFTRPDNKAQFLYLVRRLGQKEKALVRDYYLFLLHTAGERGVTSESMLVSTSTDWRQAEKFRDRRDPRKVIFYYFVPKPFDRYCISSRVALGTYDLIRHLKLPRYRLDSGLYAGQREVAVRGGLLPHFMLGILRVDRDEFVVNPHLLAMPDASLPSILEHGIHIDQDDFNEQIKASSYLRYSDLYDGEYRAYSID